MATYQALTAVSDAIVYILQSRFSPDDFDDHQFDFGVYQASDFDSPMNVGVSVFLYRVYVNSVQRTPPGRLDANGNRHRPHLPLDMYFLLTAWAQDASLQHTIVGWMMRVLEDTPILPAGLLNRDGMEIFAPDESVEIGVAELETETMFRIWEVIASNTYQISVPYVARAIKIASSYHTSAGSAIQEREFDYRAMRRP
jgi:hypothetical protein